MATFIFFSFSLFLVFLFFCFLSLSLSISLLLSVSLSLSSLPLSLSPQCLMSAYDVSDVTNCGFHHHEEIRDCRRVLLKIFPLSLLGLGGLYDRSFLVVGAALPRAFPNGGSSFVRRSNSPTPFLTCFHASFFPFWPLAGHPFSPLFSAPFRPFLPLEKCSVL